MLTLPTLSALSALPTLARAEWRAARTLPLAGGIVTALVLCAAPALASVRLSTTAAALFLHTAALLAVTGLVPLFDDPVAGVTATVPTSWWSRQVVRLVPGCGVVLAGWGVCAVLIRRLTLEPQPPFPFTEFASEVVTLCLLASALALAGARSGSASLFALPGLAVTSLVLLTLPRPLALFVDPLDEGWEGAVGRWRALGGGAVAGVVWLLRLGDPAGGVRSRAVAGG